MICISDDKNIQNGRGKFRKSNDTEENMLSHELKNILDGWEGS